MQQVKDFPNEDAPSNEEWSDFLVEQLSILAPGNPLQVIQAKVNQFVTGAQLARINPRFAQIYYQECVRQPR